MIVRMGSTILRSWNILKKIITNFELVQARWSTMMQSSLRTTISRSKNTIHCYGDFAYDMRRQARRAVKDLPDVYQNIQRRHMSPLLLPIYMPRKQSHSHRETTIDNIKNGISLVTMRTPAHRKAGNSA